MTKRGDASNNQDGQDESPKKAPDKPIQPNEDVEGGDGPIST